MATYEVKEPALHLFVDVVIGNGHTGFVEVADPPSREERERVTRDLGLAGDLVNTTVIVVAAVIMRNAKRPLLTVDLYQKDAAGARVNEQTIEAHAPPLNGRKQRNLSVHVEIF